MFNYRRHKVTKFFEIWILHSLKKVQYRYLLIFVLAFWLQVQVKFETKT